IKGGDLNYDTVIATPDAMRVVGTLGRVLGPRGLMPNPKVGTVTADVETAVANAKSGQVRSRADKAGIVHCSIGKADFEVVALKENLNALVSDLVKAKPSSSKGQYLKRMTVSSTMGPGVVVDQSTVDA
ncbi:MAG: 50S ribosomal protein L1, partial [Woeseiaceae bacterium]